MSGPAPVPPPRPSVTVVVPHHGDPALALRLLADLDAQVGAPELDVIVVDDASPVPFPEIDRPGTRVLRRDVNGGFGAAVNTGARAASGELLLIANSDLRLAPDLVGRLVDAAAPWQPAVVAPRLEGVDGAPAYNARAFPTTTQHLIEWSTPLARFRDRPLLHRAVGHDVRVQDGATFTTDWLVGALLLLPRSAFDAVGGFDESYFMNSEEIDLQRRLRAAGLPSVLVGELAARHESGASSGDHRLSWVVTSRARYTATWSGRGAADRYLRALSLVTTTNGWWSALRRRLGREVDPVAEVAPQRAAIAAAREVLR